jgi:inhibitor of cysteine peptidase
MVDDKPVSHMRASGGSVQIELPETPTSGYRWELATDDPGIAVVESTFAQSEAGRLVGASGIRTFVLAIKRRGTLQVSFLLKRSWEKDALERRDVQIDAND